MKFLVIEYHAVKAIVSAGTLQSADFLEGMNFAKALKNEEAGYFSHEIKVTEGTNGLFIFTKNCEKTKLLMFDLTTFTGFSKSDQEALTIVQKCSRVAIKMWDKIGGFSPREKYLHGSDNVVLFPLSFAVENPFRVLLDKSPDSKRQHKRGTEHYLVYWSGHGEYGQSPVLANFRRAEEGFNRIACTEHFSSQEERKDQDRFLSVETIDGSPKKLSPHMGMDYWKEHLTQSQKSFVFTDRLGPDILKGAAGTGKTLCLVLRCVNQLMEHKTNNKNIKAVLFTHSIASRESIENLIVSNGGQEFLSDSSPQSLLVTTLQEWCIQNLAGRISATEYLDKDAMESKNTQLLYISDAYDDFVREDYDTSKRFISEELREFIDQHDPWSMAVYLQNEISVYIKGRAGEDFEAYRKLPRGSTAIPLVQEDDFNTIFHIFNRYQRKLTDLNLFDSDDITISALQETSTPIWRRRKIKDGFDVLYIDETHLFNENELGLFHNLLKSRITNIVFTIDKSQAVGDCAVNSKTIKNVFHDEVEQENYGFGTVFRSTTEIIDLASCVLASGAAIFSNMENPLDNVAGGSVANSNEKCLPPYLIDCQNRVEMYSTAFKEADTIAARLKVPLSDVLIVPVNEDILVEMKEYAEKTSFKYVSIEKRGDAEAVIEAEKESKYLLGGMDYIGGLEFSAVIIVGADKDKFPPRGAALTGTSHYLLYASYNRMYVAITRAKCVVAFVYEKSKGISDILQAAFERGFVSIEKRANRVRDGL